METLELPAKRLINELIIASRERDSSWRVPDVVGSRFLAEGREGPRGGPGRFVKSAKSWGGGIILSRSNGPSLTGGDLHGRRFPSLSGSDGWSRSSFRVKSRSSDSLARVSFDRSITLPARNVYIGRDGTRDARFLRLLLRQRFSISPSSLSLSLLISHFSSLSLSLSLSLSVHLGCVTALLIFRTLFSPRKKHKTA